MGSIKHVPLQCFWDELQVIIYRFYPPTIAHDFSDVVTDVAFILMHVIFLSS